MERCGRRAARPWRRLASDYPAGWVGLALLIGAATWLGLDAMPRLASPLAESGQPRREADRPPQ